MLCTHFHLNKVTFFPHHVSDELLGFLWRRVRSIVSIFWVAFSPSTVSNFHSHCIIFHQLPNSNCPHLSLSNDIHFHHCSRHMTAVIGSRLSWPQTGENGLSGSLSVHEPRACDLVDWRKVKMYKETLALTQSTVGICKHCRTYYYSSYYTNTIIQQEYSKPVHTFPSFCWLISAV